jgi:hypothetical protein
MEISQSWRNEFHSLSPAADSCEAQESALLSPLVTALIPSQPDGLIILFSAIVFSVDYSVVSDGPRCWGILSR